MPSTMSFLLGRSFFSSHSSSYAIVLSQFFGPPTGFSRTNWRTRAHLFRSRISSSSSESRNSNSFYNFNCSYIFFADYVNILQTMSTLRWCKYDQTDQCRKSTAWRVLDISLNPLSWSDWRIHSELFAHSQRPRSILLWSSPSDRYSCSCNHINFVKIYFLKKVKI